MRKKKAAYVLIWLAVTGALFCMGMGGGSGWDDKAFEKIEREVLAKEK